MADSYSQPHVSDCSDAPISGHPDKYETSVLDTCESFGFSESIGTGSCADRQEGFGDSEEPRKIDENSNEGPNSSKMLDSLQSQPLLSESPDIRNWYSSYVYESPEIHASDGFTNFALEDNERLKESQVTKDISEEKVEKCRGSPLIINSSELIVPQHGLTTGLVCCNGSSVGEEQRGSESLSPVLDFSESPSLSSEPPHIRNWFPDYISDISDCSVSIASDCEDVSLCQLRNFEEDTFADGENNLEEAPIIATSRDAARPTVSENVGKMAFEKYSHSIVEDTEEREPMTKVQRKEDHCNQGNAFSRKTSELCLNTKTLHGTGKDLKKAVCDSSLSKEGVLKTTKYEVSSNAEPEPLATRINTRKCDGNVFEKLKSEVLTEMSSLAEDVCQPTICVPDHNGRGVGLRRTPIQGAGIKESEDISEDGFIMTKKKILKKPGKGNSLKRPEDTLFACSRNNKGSNKSERGNVETTNVQCVEANAVRGKWRCPQKSKPYRGPPMRQLRLEQWIHKM